MFVWMFCLLKKVALGCKFFMVFLRLMLDSFNVMICVFLDVMIKILIFLGNFFKNCKVKGILFVLLMFKINFMNVFYKICVLELFNIFVLSILLFFKFLV